MSEDLVLQNEYSEKCVYFMLKGAFKTSACDFAIAISGVAGEEDDKGVKAGTIFIGAFQGFLTLIIVRNPTPLR